MTLAGTIREARYEHPHGYVRLETPGKVWVVVLAPPSRMENRGLPRATLQPGVAATVVGYPNRTDPDELRAERIIIMMFTAHATEFATNGAFRLKLLLIAVALLNAFAFHRWPFKSVAGWDVAVRPPAWAKTAAVLSVLLWASVISCGRLLAYF